jgi:hypothetical protein
MNTDFTSSYDADIQAELSKSEPKDTRPPMEHIDPDLDEERLGNHLCALLKKDYTDRDASGWVDRRAYDLKAYYGLKDAWLSSWPWPNSSNYPVPITPVLLDTGHSATYQSMFNDMMKTVDVKGIGREDLTNAKKVGSLLNWQVGTDIEKMPYEMDHNIFNTYLNGTSYFKLIRNYSETGEFKIKPATIPISRIYLPIDSCSPAIEDSDHVIQLVPLTANDMMQRKALGIYKNLDAVGKGFSILGTTAEQTLNIQKQNAIGLDFNMKDSRDTYFIAEAYVSYIPKDSFKPIELIVWFAPSTGKILRKIRNDDGIRPFSDYYVYPNHGKAYHMSLPEKIKHIQEKADYTDKQVTDAADKSISPAAFYEEGTTFNPNMSLRAPSGMYPMQNSKSLQWEPVNIAPIMERSKHLTELWQQAERLTGFTDLFQGVYTSNSPTATSDVLRGKRADVRFSTIYGRINSSWKKTMNQLYYYDDKYMPRETKVKVIGYDELTTVDQLFPNEGLQESYGLQIKGKFDFNLAGAPITEIEEQKQKDIMLSDSILAHPIFGQDVGTAWKAFKRKAEAMGTRDFEAICRKPTQAYILSPEEVIMKIMSGELDVQPSIEIDPTEYQNRIILYMMTDNYKMANESKKAEFSKFLGKLEGIRIGKEMAMQDFQMRQKKAEMDAAMGMSMPQGNQGMPPANSAMAGGNGGQSQPAV